MLGWDPWLTLSARGAQCTVATRASTCQRAGNPLEVLREILARYPGFSGQRFLPLDIGLLGFLGYELNRWIEPLPPLDQSESMTPGLFMCGMQMVVLVDHLTASSWVISIVDPHQPSGHAVREAKERLEALDALLQRLHPQALVGRVGDPQEPLAIEPTMSQGAFEQMVCTAQEFIKAGDIFQANLSQRFVTSWDGPPWELYRTLRDVNPSPFACFLQTPEFAIVSCSPERLVQVRQRQVSARPIAGTRSRGSNSAEDLVNSLELLMSEKERAEHIMLVDLARNDLGRVCQFGSVHVDELMTLEDYSHVIHIVSNVRGTLRSSVDTVEIIRAVFPGGTITGCPKIRCMAIIQELEPVVRGPYTGSLGYLGFDGSLDLNILIRTMVVSSGQVTFHVGAGIVADSKPDREYHETLAKAAALVSALQRTAKRTPSDDALVR